MWNNTEGTVYLLHFDPPYRHARHYIGWSADPPARWRAHEAGRGANLPAVARAAGCTLTVVRVWPGTRAVERRKKNRGAVRICPVCSPERRIPPDQTALLRSLTEVC